MGRSTRETALVTDEQRLEARLAEARKALADLEAAAALSDTLRQEIRELETQRTALQEAGTSADELVIYLAGARGTITSTGVRGVASEISLQQIERSIARLVAAGWLAETDETAKSVGRGRGPRVYALVDAAPRFGTR